MLRRRNALALPSPSGEGKARLLLVLCLLVASAFTAAAQDNYPSRSITLIAPFAPGGSVDLVSRILADGLTTRLGQSVIIDNKPGGNGVIGIREALKARPDGYTLLMGAVGANLTPALMQPNYPFDPLRDYAPVAMIAEWSAVLVIKKDIPANTLAEFITYAKARPGALNFGATGYGGLAHLVSEVFMQQTGVRMQHVQYKGGSQGTADLLSGAIDAQMMSSPVAAGHVGNPAIKMLAVASKRRLHFIPDVPTMAEAGAPGVDQTAWQGVFAMPGLPDAIRDRISRAVVAVGSDPGHAAKLRNTGFEPLPLDAEASGRFYREEFARWSAFIKERGLAEKAAGAR
jgi:tripartite-type tricarboxylate transporter receptor subunit TctC